MYASKPCLKNWFKIIKLPDERYVKLCYNMLKCYNSLGYESWVSVKRMNLYRNGFGYIWEAHAVENECVFSCGI